PFFTAAALRLRHSARAAAPLARISAEITRGIYSSHVLVAVEPIIMLTVGQITDNSGDTFPQLLCCMIGLGNFDQLVYCLRDMMVFDHCTRISGMMRLGLKVTR